MSGQKPTRSQGDLAELIETLLDKGVVINADIAVSVGDTELLGVKLRAALASFETAAEYGLEFPSGTDMERVQKAAGLEDKPSTSTTDEEEPGQKPTQSGQSNQ
jgi:L-cysteine desulfidase